MQVLFEVQTPLDEHGDVSKNVAPEWKRLSVQFNMLLGVGKKDIIGVKRTFFEVT